MSQISLFDGTKPLKIDKPIRLVELFSGYGSQFMALKNLGVNCESWKTCEWEVNAIKASKVLHFANDNTSYSLGKTKEELINVLFELGISNDGKEPMQKESIARKNETWLRETYDNIKATHNLVNIMNVKGSDLPFDNNYFNMLFYSYPCQSLSKAGKQEGMDKGSGTRSGLLWEVERILLEINNGVGHLPSCLVMENVPDVHGTKNIHNFAKWCEFLETIGYKNYWQDLNAKHYGIPQNRDRTFMVSILGDYYYEFPKPIKLELKLKDVLEKNVDEKYYISNALLTYFEKHSEDMKEKGNGFRFTPQDGNGTAKTISTLAGNRMDDNFIAEYLPNDFKIGESYISSALRSREFKQQGVKALSGTLCARDYKDPKCVLEPIALDEQNNCLRYDIVGTITTDGSSPKHNNRIIEPFLKECGSLSNPPYDKMHESSRRVYDINGLSPTVNTVGGGNLEPKILEDFYANRDTRVYDDCPTLRADRQGLKVVEPKTVNIENYDNDIAYGYYINAMKNLNEVRCPTLHDSGVVENYRVRKLTPTECLRLMCVSDEDIKKLKNCGLSNSALYKLAGNSICVCCLESIFAQMFENIDYKEMFKKRTKYFLEQNKNG